MSVILRRSRSFYFQEPEMKEGISSIILICVEGICVFSPVLSFWDPAAS